tara:strand:+ start:1568 stop:2677 length:1110 start_codon:yes stop_codon:yes gene_type:complete
MWKKIPFEKCIQKTKVPHKLPKKEYLESGNFPVVSQEAALISGYHNEPKHVFIVSKPVVIFGDHTQVLKHVDFDFVVGADGVKILLPTDGIDSKYFYYALKTLMPKGKGYARHYGLLKKLDITIPPIAEQQRIVAKLDATFAEIDEAVLYSKQNVKNAKRLYSYGIDEIFSPLIDAVQPLGSNSEINYGFTAKASFSEGTHKLLRITDIQDNSVDWDGVPLCNIEDKKLPKMLLHDGDIVFARTGATTGKSFLVENPTDAVFASYLIRVSVDRNVLLPRYVMHFFQSETYWQQVNEGISGATQGGFNASKLAELKIPIIPIKEQLNVIFRLDKLYEQTIQLASIYEHKLEQQKALQPAIIAEELQIEAA